MSCLQVSPWRAKGAGLLTAAIVFIYTAVRLKTQTACALIAKASLHLPEGFSIHNGPFCLIANARMLSQHQFPIWVQVVLFNALSSEPEDDACIRLTGVSGGLQVSCLSYYLCSPRHGCNVMQ